jgi:hypothetical protein
MALDKQQQNERHEKHEERDGSEKDAHKALFKEGYEQDDKGDKIKKIHHEPNKEERIVAKHELDEAISPLVSKEDRRLAKEIGHTILEGHPRELQHRLNQLKDDPEKLHKMIKEIDHNLKETGADTSVRIDKDGKVLVYKDHGHAAVQIDTKTGDLSVRGIDVGPDGKVKVQPGEYPNGDPHKLMKSIGDHAVNHINEGVVFFDPPCCPFPGKPPYIGHPPVAPLKDGEKSMAIPPIKPLLDAESALRW